MKGGKPLLAVEVSAAETGFKWSDCTIFVIAGTTLGAFVVVAIAIAAY